MNFADIFLITALFSVCTHSEDLCLQIKKEETCDPSHSVLHTNTTKEEILSEVSLRLIVEISRKVKTKMASDDHAYNT